MLGEREVLAIEQGLPTVKLLILLLSFLLVALYFALVNIVLGRKFRVRDIAFQNSRCLAYEASVQHPTHRKKHRLVL